MLGPAVGLEQEPRQVLLERSGLRLPVAVDNGEMTSLSAAKDPVANIDGRLHRPLLEELDRSMVLFNAGSGSLKLLQELTSVLRAIAAPLRAATAVHRRQLVVQNKAEPAVGTVGELEGGGVRPDVETVPTLGQAPLLPVVGPPAADLQLTD